MQKNCIISKSLASRLLAFVLLCAAAMLCILSCPSIAGADVPYEPMTDTRTASKLASPYAISSVSFGDAAISSQYSEKQGMDCIFVPSGTDLSKAQLQFNMNGENDEEGAEPQVWAVNVSGDMGRNSVTATDQRDARVAVDLSSLVSFDENGVGYITVSFLDDLSAPDITYMVVVCSNTTTMFIDGKQPDMGREYVEQDKTLRAPASVVMRDAYGRDMFSALPCDYIKARGNSSFFGTDKKSYQFRLHDKQDLLGIGEPARRWNLIAMSFDPTMIRNYFSYGFAKSIGLTSTPDCRFVSLYYDGEYRGAYLLCEKIESDSARCDIGDPETRVEQANFGRDVDDNEKFPITTESNENGYPTLRYRENVKAPSNMQTGYILELDNLFYGEENAWFSLDSGEILTLREPDGVGREQVEYVRNLFQEAYDCMKAGGTHPVTGRRLSSYIDMESFAKYFFCQEFAKNIDAFTTSTFFYIKEGSEKIYAGPVWDMDDAYGSDARDVLVSAPQGYKTTFSPLMNALYNCKAFQLELVCCYNGQIKQAATKALESGGLYDVLSEKAQRYAKNNYMLHDFEYQDGRFMPVESYEQAVSDQKQWTSDRLAWMDGQMKVYGFVNGLTDLERCKTASKMFNYTHTSYYRAKWSS